MIRATATPQAGAYARPTAELIERAEGLIRRGFDLAEVTEATGLSSSILWTLARQVWEADAEVDLTRVTWINVRPVDAATSRLVLDAVLGKGGAA